MKNDTVVAGWWGEKYMNCPQRWESVEAAWGRRRVDLGAAWRWRGGGMGAAWGGVGAALRRRRGYVGTAYSCVCGASGRREAAWGLHGNGVGAAWGRHRGGVEAALRRRGDGMGAAWGAASGRRTAAWGRRGDCHSIEAAWGRCGGDMPAAWGWHGSGLQRMCLLRNPRIICVEFEYFFGTLKTPKRGQLWVNSKPDPPDCGGPKKVFAWPSGVKNALWNRVGQASWRKVEGCWEKMVMRWPREESGKVLKKKQSMVIRCSGKCAGFNYGFNYAFVYNSKTSYGSPNCGRIMRTWKVPLRGLMAVSCLQCYGFLEMVNIVSSSDALNDLEIQRRKWITRKLLCAFAH